MRLFGINFLTYGMRLLLLIALLGCLCTGLSAQGYYWQGTKKKQYIKYLTVEAGPGVRMYFGDVQQSGSNLNKIRIGYQLGLRYQLRPRWGIALKLGGRGYRGEKTLGLPGAYNRMTGKLWEGMVTGQFSWVPWEDFNIRQFTERDPVSKSNLYVGLGVGGSQFSASYVTNYISGDSLVSEFEGGSASGIAIFVPFSFGFRYRFDPTWSLGFEMTYFMYFSDKIDAFERQRRDSMGMFLVKLGYSFGQKSWIRKK